MHIQQAEEEEFLLRLFFCIQGRPVNPGGKASNLTSKGNAVQKRAKQSVHSGFTLLELVIAALVLGVVSVGAMGYHYHARRMSLRAKVEIAAARTGRLILDNWKKAGGDENFDLTTLQMGFSKSVSTDDYRVTIDGVPMSVTLDWQDIDNDPLAMVTLRQIETAIRWRSNFQPGAVQDSDPRYVISTYVRKEESGG